MIVFENVNYTYARGGHALRDLSFHIREGEQVGLIGANGAGKSTLMKAALGLVGVQGKILIDTMKMEPENLPAIRRTLGYVLQDSEQQMFMPTVLEDMVFGPVNYGMARPEAEEKAVQCLKDLGMEYLKDRHNHRISGGEKRMAAIATVLAMEPRVLLMDEPSASLDPRNRRNLINMLNRLPVTKVIASHDLDLVLETCDRVLLMSEGKLAADGPADDILRDRELLEANGLELPFCLAGVPARHVCS